MTGWITIDRKMLDWRWHDDPNMVALLVYLLLSANIEPKKWHNIVVGRGQLVTSRRKLYVATGIPEQTIRTCLERMRDDKTITIQSTNQFSVVTICKYDDYQLIRDDNQPTNQPSINHQSTTTKQYNNINITHTARAYEVEESRNIVIGNQTWKEQFCMKHKGMTLQALERYINDFFDTMALQMKTWDAENDIYAHFINWFNKNGEKEMVYGVTVQPKYRCSQMELDRRAESEARHAEFEKAKANAMPMPESLKKRLGI